MDQETLDRIVRLERQLQEMRGLHAVQSNPGLVTVNQDTLIDGDLHVTGDFDLDGNAPIWSNISDKPATFPPEAHTQDWSTITGKPATYPPSAHTHESPDLYLSGANLLYAELTGWTPTFTNLPAGWSLVTGSYKLARVGRLVFLEITLYGKIGSTGATSINNLPLYAAADVMFPIVNISTAAFKNWARVIGWNLQMYPFAVSGANEYFVFNGVYYTSSV